jgi:hypothetical protein
VSDAQAGLSGWVRRYWIILVFLLSIGVLIIGPAALVYWRWSDYRRFSAQWGGEIGVGAAWLSLVGFGLTIFAVLATHRAEQKADHEIHRAQTEMQASLEALREENRNTIERIGVALVTRETAALLQAARQLQSACGQGQWQPAMTLCQEITHAVLALCGHPHLTDAERDDLRSATADMNQIRLHIQNYRLGSDSTKRGLVKEKDEALVRVIDRIYAIDNRLKRETLEVPHG